MKFIGLFTFSYGSNQNQQGACLFDVACSCFVMVCRHFSCGWVQLSPTLNTCQVERKIYVAMNVFDKMSQHGPKHLFLRKLTLNLLLQYYSTSVLMHTRPKNNNTEELLLDDHETTGKTITTIYSVMCIYNHCSCIQVNYIGCSYMASSTYPTPS